AVAQISVGSALSCARADSGETWCWGQNSDGEVGTSATPDRCGFDFCAKTPARISTARTYSDVDAGILGACALDMAGAAYCWGSRDDGQLRAANYNCAVNGNESPCATTPMAVTGGLTFKALTVGRLHTCGITTDNRVMCWGGNAAGQLGDGTVTPHATPAEVTAMWSDDVALGSTSALRTNQW